MNVLGLLSLFWTIFKTVVNNELVNKAIDNWTKGTSTNIDDLVWELIEKATGQKDIETQKKMIADGLEAIQAQYVDAKANDPAKLKMLRGVRRTWTPPTQDQIRALLTGETVTIGEG